jgi:hypothetical protein
VSSPFSKQRISFLIPASFKLLRISPACPTSSSANIITDSFFILPPQRKIYCYVKTKNISSSFIHYFDQHLLSGLLDAIVNKGFYIINNEKTDTLSGVGVRKLQEFSGIEISVIVNYRDG